MNDLRPPEGPVTLLEMRDITKDFSGGRVLFGVDLSLLAGEVHALVGQNGAGKSTLMKILAGVYPDYGGRVRLAGETIDLRDPRQALDHGVAVIYQDFMLVPEMTVAENIALGHEPGKRGLVAHSRVREASAAEAARLGIELPIDAPVKQLGVAGQQLTEIVKAISRRARILVMDEPTARLSGSERERLFATMRDLAASGVGIVYISHFLEEIFEVADRVTVLRDGRVVKVESTARLDLPRLAGLIVGHAMADRRLAGPRLAARGRRPSASRGSGCRVVRVCLTSTSLPARSSAYRVSSVRGARAWPGDSWAWNAPWSAP